MFNTCVAFDRDGSILVKHRKMHLFDIDIPGGIRFMESDVLSAGDSLSIIGACLSVCVYTNVVSRSVTSPLGACSPSMCADTAYGKIGLGICYDMRFAHLSLLYGQLGCKMIVFPGAFNTTTGPSHWELLLRARAIDSQVRDS